MKNNSISRDRSWLKSIRLPAQVFFALLLAFTVAAQGPPVDSSLQGQGTLEVMTYNMYAGTEYTGMNTASTLDGLYLATTNAINDVRAGNPPARAQEIARQIAAAKPDLVSLQEVATWSTGTYTGEWTGTSTCQSLTTEYDYRQLLLNALTAQGVHYTPVATNTHFTMDAPTSATACIHNTWSIVVLARADLSPEDFSYSNVQIATFTKVFEIPIAAITGYRLPWPRGWVSVDVSYRGKQFRFIATHMDGLVPPPLSPTGSPLYFNVGQGSELLDGPANTTMPVVIAGDTNADASNASDPTYQTYQNFLNAGFTDAWTAARSLFDSGFSGFTRTYPSPMDTRSDLVLVRGNFKVQAAAVLCGGSDHCGVVGRLQAPAE